MTILETICTLVFFMKLNHSYSLIIVLLICITVTMLLSFRGFHGNSKQKAAEYASLKTAIADLRKQVNHLSLNNSLLASQIQTQETLSLLGAGQCNDAHLVRQCARTVFYYETPLSEWPHTHKYRARFSMIPDEVIDWQWESQLALWQDKLKKWKSLYDQESPFVPNGMIPIEDDYLLFAMIMAFEPQTVLEIGSGFSTKTAHNAMNNLPNPETRKHICIEPFRDEVIDKSRNKNVPLEVIQQIVQDVDSALFARLRANDILFIDSSHVTKAFGDTILELVFILPILPIGVVVHIHDICLPENYPEVWLNDGGGKAEYTEQYFLAAFLYGNSKWKVIWSNWYMGMKSPQVFRDIGLPGEKHGSIWLQKVA
jgi:hypothetical protein